MTQVADQSLTGTTANPAAKDLARDMYLGGKTQTAIAGQLGVHPKTIAYWAKQNNWQELKACICLGPIIIRHNLYTQLAALSDAIVTRAETNGCPTSKEVLMQYKLVQAIFKFPDFTPDDIEQIYNELDQLNKNTPAKKVAASGRDLTKHIDNQFIESKIADKEGIKMDKERIKENAAAGTNAAYVDADYTPKKNVILRSGVRWIEKGVVYDPSTRQNRKLSKSEYDELIRKGLTKKDFQGWLPA